MAITATSTFSTELATFDKVFLWAVELTDGTTSYYYTSGTLTTPGDFSGASETLVPIRLDQSADPKESRFATATFEFELRDVEGTPTSDVAAGFIGYTCNFYAIFWGFNFTVDKLQRFGGVVKDVDLKDGVYKVRAQSAISFAEKKLFAGGRSTLFADIDASVDKLHMVDASGIVASGGTVRVNSERIDYTSATDVGNGSWLLDGLTRGAHGSTAAAHSAGDKVQEVFIIASAHPFQIYEDILSGTGEKDGLGLSAWVDSSALSTLQTDVGSTFRMSFELSDEVVGKEFLEQQILKPMGAYPIESETGLISAKLIDTPESADFIGTITDGECIKRAVWHGNFPRQVNVVHYDHTWNDIDKTYDGAYDNRGESLITLANGREYTLTMGAKGIDLDLTDTDDLLDQRSEAYKARFGSAFPVIGVEAIFASAFLWEMGDPVFATLSDVVSLPAATRSLTVAPMEIIRMQIDFQRNVLKMDMLGYPSVVALPLTPFVAQSKHTITGATITVA